MKDSRVPFDRDRGVLFIQSYAISGIQEVVAAFGGYELVVSTAFYDFSVLQNYDFVGIAYG